jgi:hypothetical protein
MQTRNCLNFKATTDEQVFFDKFSFEEVFLIHFLAAVHMNMKFGTRAKALWQGN